MKWKVILHNLKHGTERLEGLVVSKKPTPEQIATAVIFYGAEKATLEEVYETEGETA